MAVLAECDICGNQHRVKESLVGTKIRCRDCAAEFKVPEDHEITADRFFEEDGRLHPRIEEIESGMGAYTLILGGASLLAISLAIIIWLFVLLYRLVF